MADMSFAMLLRLMDGWSGPADKIRLSMQRMSGSARKLRADFGKRIKTGFHADELEAAMRRSEGRIAAFRARLLGAGAMAVTLGAPVIKAGDYEERLIDFANLAEIPRERVELLKAEIDELRKSTGQSSFQVLDGLEAYVGKGMGLDEALAGMKATGKAAKATRAAMGEMANSGFAVMDNLGVAPDRLRKAFDIMAKSGKEGSFELGAMARKFPEITAGAKALKMEGEDAVATLAAALQVTMKSAGTEDQAATNMANFLGKITAPDTVKKFKKFGVDIEQEMRIALERGTDPLVHMLKVIEEMTGGDAFKMGELFADKQVLDFLRAMIPNLEEFERIKKEALGADGVIDKDWAKVMKGFKEETRQFSQSLTALLYSGGALLPIFTDIVREARFAVEAVGAWAAANPELTETIIKGTAALLAFGIGTRVLSYGFALMSGGILRTAGLFLKFNDEGKNISVVSRTVRGLGRSLGWTARRGMGLARLVSKPLSWTIRPLRWTARLIPAIPWRGLAKMLRWGTLVRPLSWTARLIPAIGWAGMAGRLGKFGMNAKGWGRLITPLKWFAKTGLRFIPVIGWAMFAWELGKFLWDYVLDPLGWSDWIKPEALQRAWDALPTLFWSDKIKQERPKIEATPGFEKLPDAKRGAASELDAQMREGKAKGNLATDDYIETLQGDIQDFGQQVQNLKTQLAIIKDGPTADTLRRPIQKQIDILTEELDFATNELAAARARRQAVLDALPEATGQDAPDRVDEDAITAAIKQIKTEAAQQNAGDTAAAIEKSLAPITAAIREGRKSETAPEKSLRPQARPYEAPQPNVTVESTFESNPSVDVNVKVSMPISITRVQQVNNAKIAKDAGRQAGAATERAVRRSLDDAANVE
ncbi:MAG: phage tail tape measure protein [Rhodobacterales bacterium]|nr:MAG: phage tail tape measure protein [Rhodobacterales bacterium]